MRFGYGVLAQKRVSWSVYPQHDRIEAVVALGTVRQRVCVVVMLVDTSSLA